jgi:hypothetical protein
MVGESVKLIISQGFGTGEHPRQEIEKKLGR